MRKQRYQRNIAQNKDPERVNTDTSDQDMKLLNSQLQGLKYIWAEEKEEKTKKGKSYNAIAQTVLDHRNNVRNWSASEADLTPEELLERQSKFGGQEYSDMSEAFVANPANKSPLKMVVEGDNVEIADNIREGLISKFGEDEYQNYIAYTAENQEPLDKTREFAKLASAVPTRNYTDDYFSKRGVNPDDYLSKQDVAELHISKYTQKAKDYIDGIELTPENTFDVTTKLAARIKESNLPDNKSQELSEYLTNKLSAQERKREAIAKAKSNKITSDYMQGNINSIKDYSILTDTDAKAVGNSEFIKNAQDLEDGKMTWKKFTNLPVGERAKDVYRTKLDQKIDQEYRKIKTFAADSKNIFALNMPKNVPVNQELAVELTYNYYNERKRQDPNFTMDDARGELYSESSSKGIRNLLADSHRDIEKLGLTTPEYINLFKSEAGRIKIIELGIKKGTDAFSYSQAYISTMDEDNVTRRPKDSTPRTN